MARIKIEDIPDDHVISDEGLDEVSGGVTYSSLSSLSLYSSPSLTSFSYPRYVGIEPSRLSFGSVSAGSCGVCGVRG